MEIKVKVWHKLLKEFVKPYRFLVIGDDGKLWNDDVEIVLFTGLYDKNGKEIFEGTSCQRHLQTENMQKILSTRFSMLA